MRNLEIAVRSLFKRGSHNVMKILSLGIGLAVGLVLIAKVYMEQSYDDFVQDADRIYQVQTVALQNGELREWERVPGGVVVGMKEEMPRVEQATRFTELLENAPLTMVKSQRKYRAHQVVLADTSFFDLFTRPVLVGDPKEVLAAKRQVMISDELAEKLGGDVVGQTFTLQDMPGYELTIGGIFRAFPEKSLLYEKDVLLSMSSAWDLWSWDSAHNWMGNDRYMGFVKLQAGVSPESLTDELAALYANHVDQEAVEKMGYEIHFTLHALSNLHDSQPTVKRMIWLLSLLAFALILTAVMNYILIVVSSIINRTKEISVRKCYGASAGNIHGLVFSEAFVHLLLSLVVAGLLVVVCQDWVAELLSASLSTLFVSKGTLLLAVICLLVLLTTGLVPGFLFVRIPVAAAFRNLKENKRHWKLALLFVQFVAAGFLLSLLVVIDRQYHRMTHDNPGYACEDLAYCQLSGTDSLSRVKLIDELSRLPEVKAVSSGSSLFYEGASGNLIHLPGVEQALFNIADLYWCGDGYLDLFDIPVVAGSSFTEHVSSSHEVMVSRSFVEKMQTLQDWSDGAVGKQIFVTEHSQHITESEARDVFTICGVYEDFQIGSLEQLDKRPSVLFYRAAPSELVMIRFHRLDSQAMMRAQQTLQQLFPDKEFFLHSYRAELNNCYRDSRRFRDSVLIGGLVTLVISLIGLVGYTADEVSRRRREIAIRRVNGATTREVIGMFMSDVARIALPSVLTGAGIAYFVAQQWLSQFADKVPLSWYFFLGSVLLVLLIVLTVVGWQSNQAAHENPVVALKSE
ncbi:MAG: ABC transporter permease [Parabacteroides sp.]